MLDSMAAAPSSAAAPAPLDPAKIPNQKFFAVMEGIEAYLAAQEELAAALKDGLFDLAKAKYTLGPGAVGQQCYPGDMHAAAAVHPQQPEQESDSLFDQFDLCQQLQDCHLAAKAAATPQQEQDKASGGKQQEQQLRQRRKGSQQQLGSSTPQQQQGEQHDPPPSTASSSSGDDDAYHQADPITWFTALPPAALKSAQGHFRVALQRAVAAANRVQQLREMLEDLVDTCSREGGADPAGM